MKGLPSWVISVIILVCIAVAIFTAGQFAKGPEIIVSGLVEVPDSMREEAKKASTLFLVLYDADSPRPMPYGAYKQELNGSGESVSFLLTPEKLNVMGADAVIPKTFRLKARFDRDGQGGADQPGDLTGELKSIAYGSKDTKIMLETMVQAQ